MKKKVSLASVLLFVFFVAMVTVGCSDVFLKGGDNFSVSFVTPGNSSSRNATGADWSIRAWLELEDGTKLQNKTTTASAGQSVSIVFDSVPAGISLQVKVELAKGTSIKYAGRSKTVVVKAGNNELSLALQQVVSDWTSLREVLYSGGTGNIYLYGDFIANETISGINGSPNLIAYGPVTFTREDGFTGALIQNSTPWTISGSPSSPIAFDGKNESVGNPMISAEADLTMTYCTMQNNVNTSTSGGGAIYATGGTLTLENCTFTGNKTTDNMSPGGAIRLENSGSSIITNTIFSSNRTEGGYSNGGAIAFENTGDNILVNCTFNDNVVAETGYAGGIYISQSSEISLNSITMSNNVIASSSVTLQDIFLQYDGHIYLGGSLKIPSLTWARSTSGTYKEVFTSGSVIDTSSVQFEGMASSIGLQITGTMTDSTLQLFVQDTQLSQDQIASFVAISDEDGRSYTLGFNGSITRQ